jgi:RimJ/RimL family protein N-acetyltransferase
MDCGDSTEVSLWLSPHFQNRGIAREALRMLEELITQWGIDTINYMADFDNIVSQKLALNSGYVPMQLDAITNACLYYKELGKH